MPKAIGIDLGTTFSVAAYLDRGRPLLIPNSEGERLTPSVVSFLGGGKRLVGKPAQGQASANPQGTIFSIKRRMGRRAYLDGDGIGIDGRSNGRIRVEDSEYTPEEVSAMILQKLKADAETYLGEKVERGVISVPAYFNVSQRQATMDAAAIAGLQVMRIIDEPTAAALAYGLDLEAVHTILVWDLGGGTFDVSILELGDGIFEVKAVNGNTWLGGDDYDQRIVDWLVSELQERYGVDLGDDRAAQLRLKEAAEKAKIELTEAEAAPIRIPVVDANDGGCQAWETTLTRAKFAELTEDLRQKMVHPTQQALADAGLKAEDIDRVILVGGATRMPAVRQLCRQLIGKEPYTDVPPEEAIALGAAIQAGILTGEISGKVLLDVTPLSLGIETQGGLFTKIIPRNTPIPVSQGQVFTNARDDQTTMDIHVLQGERDLAVDNMTLARFELAGIPTAPRGEARVEVTFDIDVNGILHVSAQELYSESAQRLRVNPRFYGLPREELSRMIEEARRFAEEDQMQRQAVELNIKAGNVVQAAQQTIQEARRNGDTSLLDAVERGEAELVAALAMGNGDEIKSKTEALENLGKALRAQNLSGKEERDGVGTPSHEAEYR